MTATTVTPILFADDLQPCIEFWQRLGFTRTVTVPDAPPYGFAIMAAGRLEIMLQTRQSAEQDLTGAAAFGPATIYVGVPAIEPVIGLIDPATVAVPRRKTFYGADEIWVHDPAGNLVGFAAHAGAD